MPDSEAQAPPIQARPADRLEITISIDTDQLDRCGDAHLAMLWHVAQANPAPHGDPTAGRLVEKIGREIIRRWLKATTPELWHHQGADYYWSELGKLATYKPGSEDVYSPEWHRGTWVPRDAAAAGETNGE